jgi:hypothetical protein
VTDVAVPRAVALKGLPDVELVAVGSWKASTGPVTITLADLQAALTARECPGVHNPVIKLGHEEATPGDDRMRWDGTPAVGWVSNMRLSANDAKLLGDYTGVPAWLIDVMPSAYPQRSVEIQRDFRCQVGHTHPFVITAVSLLGIYPPAVGVIRSLNDVQALYTLAATDGHPGAEITSSIAAHLAAPVNTDTRRPLTEIEERAGVDFAADLDDWDAAVARLVSAYQVVQRRQREQLTAQIAPLVDAGRLGELAAMQVDSQAAADTLYEAMLAAATAAAVQQTVEAAAQGIVGLTGVPDELYLRRAADGIAATMASSLSAVAGRDAAQLAAPGVSGLGVAEQVNDKLSDLSDRFLRDQFGGAIGAARMAGRHAVLSVAPTGEHYAAELNDSSTCRACKAIDGHRFSDLDSAMGAYGSGGYHLCEGGGRCRGRLITVWGADMRQLSTLALRVGDRTYFTRVETKKTTKKVGKSGKQLKDYWVHGEGAAKWSTWTELYHHLLKYLPEAEAKRTAADWFHERYGFWPGDKKNDKAAVPARIPLRVGSDILLAGISLKFNPHQRRDPDGKWGDGVPNGGVGAAAGLLDGKHAVVGRDDLPDLMKTLATSSPTNLTRLKVNGEPNLFNKHSRDIPRAEMPQLPVRVNELERFTDALADRKITGVLEEVDPRTLNATQNELDSVKVAQIYALSQEGKLNPDSIAFISKDGDVLDGHHRWAALAAQSATGDDVKMKVMRLDADIDTLLEVANGVSGPRKAVGEGDGHTLGTKFDTPVDKYGMTYSADAAKDPRVRELKTDDAAWDDVPAKAFMLKNADLIATEEYLRSKPINKVVGGTEPFREGYDAHLLRTDDGYVVIDGHHRVAMYIALGRETMPARIIDGRSKGKS